MRASFRVYQDSHHEDLGRHVWKALTKHILHTKISLITFSQVSLCLFHKHRVGTLAWTNIELSNKFMQEHELSKLQARR